MGAPPPTHHGFAIIGYGKLGGIELGYASDLDLVFLYRHAFDKLRHRSLEDYLHTQSLGVGALAACVNGGVGCPHISNIESDPHIQTEQTTGTNPVPNEVFYARLAQRLVSTLNTRTHSGILYEVDTRLRPNGNAGLLVSSLEAFAHYQTTSAWVWEHQALLRARPIAGDPLVRARFQAIRLQTLTQRRDNTNLQTSVREMREKMRLQLDRSRAGLFDLKQGHGGIIDIEFMVQYQVLCWAADYPDLLDWTDTIRWLETLTRHALVPAAKTQILADAYRALRGAAHRLTLQNESGLLPDQDGGVGCPHISQLANERSQVQTIWQTWMEA